MHDIKLMTEKNAPAWRAISKAMQIRWYNAEQIAQYSRSRATLDATGCCHWASISILPVDAVVIDFGVKKWSCGVVKSLFEGSVQKAQMDPLLSSSKQQAA